VKISRKNLNRQEKKQNARNLKSKIKKKLRNLERAKRSQVRKCLVFKLFQTIRQHFPDLYEKIRGEIGDCRDKPDYDIVEIIMAAVAMFLFKKGSRNATNNERAEEKFKRNYEKIFKISFPHMDTVDRVMRLLKEEQLEKLKTELVKVLIKKKVFYKFRFLGKFYLVAVDGTHVMNVNKDHCEHCLHSTSKTGKVRYFHNVLEAKLVCENGFCISLATEWIENEEDFDKQDCEQKAFVRLAKKLKRDYPRLPLCIIADALYPNQTFFNICEKYGWGWIVTFKDGNLPSVWKEVLCLEKFMGKNMFKSRLNKDGKEIYHTYTWIDDIDYHGFNLNWFECVEEEKNSSKRFVYISNFKVDYQNVLEMTTSGRMRWKIENEGFDIQKNHGYGLKHKYSRISMQATKNYYQCMQIAHMINQLFELGSLLQPLLRAKQTIIHLWEFMLGEMRHTILDIQVLKKLLRHRIQIRYG
jgi:hypothetical protein